ncbi:MAG: type VI secretion system baseplate subunit TssK [Solidesulfovibrio sp. DCME]|uniref:type VI secretion system baseplate subunit TssK n=1 Tax=Solidesulfovibrio sp. DCME TaxID=3447380 RepID=UPI003D096A57
MDVLKSLYWSQGVFLQPQHFQLTDQGTRARFSVLQAYGHNHFWGVGKLAINEAALANQSFEIRRAELIFDDGEFVSIPATAQPLARSFAGLWTASDKPMAVFVGLHRLNPFGSNVTEVADPEAAALAPTRYVTGQDPEEAPDLHADGPAAQVKRLSHSLKIFFEPERERMNDYHVIRLARLVREGDKVVVSPSHIPPSLALDAWPALADLVQEIRDLTAARCRVLEQYKSPNTMRRTAMDLRYMVYLMALATLNRHLPALNHLQTATRVHPWPAYGLLCQFIGELSTFSATINASGEARDGRLLLPPYNHLDLWACFAAARQLCGELLEGIILGPEYLIPLVRKEEFHVAAPPEGVFKPDRAYWLILKTEQDVSPIRAAIGQHVKLGASTTIATLIAMAVPGAGLEYSEDPPSGMPMDTTVTYFRIDRLSPAWLEIEKTRTIAMYWPEAPEDLAAEIAVIRQ